MSRSSLLLLAALARFVAAIQPDASPAVAAPLRHLPWGQLNFLHTTDVHGWYGGHLQEPSFSADWGDYISLAEHLQRKADSEGVDLLLVDTGDRIEGNGLYDASEPKGRYTSSILKEQRIDLLSSGNHELYKQNSSERELFETVPAFHGKYIASNLDIYNPETGEIQPLAQRFKRFTTKNLGIRITAFGFLFDFTGNFNNTIVQRVQDTVNEQWFQEAIHTDEVDLFVIFGHVALHSPEYDLLHRAIRSVHWDVPIALFGGHSHIRDYRLYDYKAAGLQSGRYMETIGFMSVTGVSTPDDPQPPTRSPTWSRRYMDNNLFSFHHHTGTNETTFPTSHGLKVSNMITKARKNLHLSDVIGCTPRDMWVNRAPYGSDASIFTWLEDSVLPDQLAGSPRVAGKGKKALAITNTGAIRFDMFKGAFTQDTQYLVSPFTSGFKFIADVPLDDAKGVIELLNGGGQMMTTAEAHGLQSWMLAPPEQISPRPGRASVLPPVRSDQQVLRKPELIPGYTTLDEAGDDGDDTLHEALRFYSVPNCIQAPVGDWSLEDKKLPPVVDLVYGDFIEPWVMVALEYLGYKVAPDDVQLWMKGKMMTEMMTEWVAENWPPVDGKCT
ncbi:ser/Thr protein phosphatase family [Trichodelitschia bisporula]|uniref:Ser/Thr protein phosphatase family n=1 Tax=Trichodelitschia bisporula TaxID=703511 RepID=A0A6G1HRH6_9PEZI|nr:ser/Thr protein phosphatase family [Trichodelitschia bisporula]